MTASIWRASFSISARSVPSTFTPTGVRMPVESMSMRALNRPSVGYTGELQRLVHVRDELVDGDAGTPFALRLEIDHALEHFGRRGVGCGRGAPGLAPDRGHFGERLDPDLLGDRDRNGNFKHGLW